MLSSVLAMKIVFFKSPSEFRSWLAAHHSAFPELWIGFYNKRAAKKGITYPEALDEALCFGWIDGVRKSLDQTRYFIRFTPRKQRSKWSLVNIKRVAALTKLGRMQPPGLKAFRERDKKNSGYSYEQRPRKLPGRYERKLRANTGAWAFFKAQAPWYQRSAAWWVISAKQEETRLRRLSILIDASANGRRLGPLTPALRLPN